MPRIPFFQAYKSVLSHRPLVVGSLAGPTDFQGQCQRARVSRVDIVELRLDTLPLGSILSASQLKKPLLLTIRSASESGPQARQTGLSDDERVRLFELLMPLCDLVDIELANTALARWVTRRAKKKNVSVIHSHHNFRGMGQPSQWQMLLRKSVGLGGDLLKLALTPRSQEDFDRLMLWGVSQSHRKTALIAMGSMGEPSRTLGYCFGSLLTYGHFGASTAPGQPSAESLVQTVRHLYS